MSQGQPIIVITSPDSATPTHRRNYGTADDRDTTAAPAPDQCRSTLHFIHRIGFGLGHIYNDLCASIWFSYTLLFLQACLDMPAQVAGSLLMIGQVGDAVATSFVGVLSDRYGTKRKWHIFGTILVFLTFPMIFSVCPWCSDAPPWWPPLYFTVIIILFQIAWPIVQVTHLAMISEMSVTTKDRSDLTSIRYSATIVASIVAYVVTWILLGDHEESSKGIGHEDRSRLRDISLILTLFGLTMSVLFHFSLAMSGYERRRVMATHQSVEPEADKLLPAVAAAATPPASIRSFLKSPLLYQYGFLYVFARLFCTTSLVYMPLWINERCIIATKQVTYANRGLFTSSSVAYVATVPLVSFLSSFVTASLFKCLNHRISQQFAYFLGSALSVVGPVCVYYIQPEEITSLVMYVIAIFFGAGSSITMVSSLCLIADLIGNNKQKGGFVYSAVTFADKLISGIIIFIIESLKCHNKADCPTYYRAVLSYLCCAAAILGFIVLLSLRCVPRRSV